MEEGRPAVAAEAGSRGSQHAEAAEAASEPAEAAKLPYACNIFVYSRSPAAVACYDFSEESGYTDNLNVEVKTKTFASFLVNEAYK